MEISIDRLNSLDTDFRGYLEGDVVNRFFDAFGIKFAAGHWCAGEFRDRFCPVGYNSNNPDFIDTTVTQIARIKQAGIKGIEFHEDVFVDNNHLKDPAKVSEITDALKLHGLIPTCMNMNTWGDPKWKFGGVTNPDPAIRRDCLALCLQGVEMAKEIGFASCNLWPGSDGWDYHFEVDYGKRFDWFIDGCTQIAKKCQDLGLKFGTEPKQKEPREGNMITNTVGKAALVAKEVNNTLGAVVMGVVIDYGHEQMAGNQPADSLYMLKRIGVPIANFHINAAKYNSNDEDRITGTDDIWRLTEFCYAAIDTGYDGWFGEDQFTYRCEQVKAMELSKEMFANCMKRALKIYRVKDKLQAAQDTGMSEKCIDVVKKIIYGEA